MEFAVNERMFMMFVIGSFEVLLLCNIRMSIDSMR